MAVERFWEVDFARGIAVVAMLAFNWQFALQYFGLYEFDASAGGFWWFFARATVAAFVFLAGLSLSISFAKASAELSSRELFKKFFARATKIFALGLLATLATLVFFKNGSGFVVFGVLQLIGLSTLLAYPLLRSRSAGKTIAFTGIALIAAGLLLSGAVFGFPWLVWLGFVPSGFYSVDYVPVLPWFGVMLLGVAFGKKFYNRERRKFSVPEFSFSKTLSAPICFLGRHSLAVYVLHQPLLLVALHAAGLL